MASKVLEVLKPLKIYWKSLFIIIFSTMLLPIFLVNNTSEMRCLYVVCIMAGFWVFEVLPIAVTGLIPIALFPFMGVLDTLTVAKAYFKEANMMFVGGLIVALAIEYCNLHIRISLHCIKWVSKTTFVK